MAACSSSGGGTTNNTSAPPGGSSSSTSSSNGGGKTGCASGTLNAAGSTAQANAMDAWRNAYDQKCGTTINYSPTSSGDGVTAFNQGSIDFAGSDAALDPTAGEVAAAQKRCGSTPLNIPMVVGPIAIAYNLKGVNKLVMNGELLAKIFLGKIKMWNDPAIAAVNKGVKLPAEKISSFYRSDSSGTTKNFEKYLAANAPSVFTSEPDKDSSKAGFAGQGVAGSQGVTQSVSQTAGSITYVEYSYAVNASLPTAELDNGGGPVALSISSASKAAGTAKVVGKGKDLSLSIDYAQKTAGAYPLILVTYEIVCSKYPSSDASKAPLIKSFLQYTSSDGQQLLPQKGYAPLPTALLSKVKASVATIS
jgi:phosphate transport system substrate-binding protein